jgi:pimeloyl-ACP methyl ester carboxylesterase
MSIIYRRRRYIMKFANFMLKLFITSFIIFSCSVSGAQASDSGYIKLGKDSIFYETSGTGSVIVFIHDGMLSSEVWNDQFSFFTNDFHVIRYDRRGYGKSSPATGEYTHLNDLETLFKHLEIDSAILVACS